VRKRWLGCGLLIVLAAAPLGAGPSEEERIDGVLKAIVEAYNTGDFAAMGRHYAPDFTLVSADYSPPLTGWSNVEDRFRQAYARYAQYALTRENTKIVRRGKLAWATYDWRFAGVAGGQSVEAFGHTTLVLEKREGDWLVVHNHSSLAPPPTAPPPAPAGEPK
jgi:uncharacterized protein (TIGR02246 family)